MKARSQLRTFILLIGIVGITLSTIPVISEDFKFESVIAYKNPRIQIKKIKNKPKTIATIVKPKAFPTQKKDWIGLPLKLIIPNIGVNANIEYVGLTSLGYMDTPDGIVNAAWFDHSTLPGEKGSAIIDGHFGWKNGKPAVFNNLNKLVQGDRIYILEANGATLTFVVNKVKSYDLNDNAPEIFKVDDSLSHLNIITCHGTWDKDDKIYSDRLVVFADRLIE